MSFNIEMLPDEPIILMTVYTDFDPEHDMPVIESQLREMLDAAETTLDFVLNFSQVSLSLDQVISIINSVTRGENPLLHHPNMGKQARVTSNRMIQLAAKGLNSKAFGFLSVNVFETVDDALEYIRADEYAHE